MYSVLSLAIKLSSDHNNLCDSQKSINRLLGTEKMDVSEYRKFIETPPVTLHREDIKELARILTEKLPVHPKAFDFCFSYCDAQFRADSIEELLKQKLPPTVDGVAFSVLGWSDEGGIDRGITFNLTRTTGYYQIHALDETWFKGKIQQINEFLNLRRPWYALNRMSLAGLLGAGQTLAFFAFLFFIFQRSIVCGAFAVLCVALLQFIFHKIWNM